jgi:hypothetical protein
MHRTIFKAVKKTYRDNNQRRWLLLDIAVCLLCGRAQVDTRDQTILHDEVAADA